MKERLWFDFCCFLHNGYFKIKTEFRKFLWWKWVMTVRLLGIFRTQQHIKKCFSDWRNTNIILYSIFFISDQHVWLICWVGKERLNQICDILPSGSWPGRNSHGRKGQKSFGHHFISANHTHQLISQTLVWIFICQISINNIGTYENIT